MGQNPRYPNKEEVLPSPRAEEACKESWEVFRSERTYLPHWEKLAMITRVGWRNTIQRAIEVMDEAEKGTK